MRRSVIISIVSVVALASCTDDGSRGGSVDDAGTTDSATSDDVSNSSDVSGSDMQGDSGSDMQGDSGSMLPPPGPDPDCSDATNPGSPPDGTVPGEVTTPHPTLNNITVEWAIEGDQNLDGHVRVRYRPESSERWRPAMPLRRIPAGSNVGYSWGNRHSGSVLDLEPGTTYEIELWLQDPDGGCQIETVTAETRPLPEPMPGAPVKEVTPDTLSSTLSSAQPGDIIELGAGTYDAFDVPVDGEPGREIVIRSTEGAVVDGTVDASGRQFVQIIGLTANRIRFDQSKRISIMGNTVNLEEQFDGIGAWNRAEDAYVVDNVVTSTTDWTEAALGVDGDNFGECILVVGPGHVIAHNEVSGCRDNISFIEGSEGVDQFSIDIIGNDIHEAADDGVEADFCAHNCRIMRNRFTNVFIAMSSQPSLGGPTYFIRNVAYSNLYIAAFKLYRGSIGDVVLHNTVVKAGDALGITSGAAHSRQYFRNNLFIGGEGSTWGGWGNGEGRIVFLPDAVDGDYDYDGLGSANGNFSGRIGGVTFADFDELRNKTTYANAVRVDLGVFSRDVEIPSSPFPAYEPVDLSLEPGSAAVDAAQVLPNVNDGYRGEAPDIGAYELGEPPPSYGPR